MIFYDHAANYTDPAEARDLELRRREAIASGESLRVTFVAETGCLLYWDGPRREVLSLARQLAGEHYRGVAVRDGLRNPVDFLRVRY